MSIEWSNGRIEWSDAYKLGVEMMDTEHKGLLDLVNAIEDGIDQAAPTEEIKGRIEALCDRAIEHFSHEEEAMAKSGFAELEAHRKIHQNLLGSLQGVAEDFAAGQVEKAEKDLLEFAKIFFASHIPMIDSKFAATQVS